MQRGSRSLRQGSNIGWTSSKMLFYEADDLLDGITYEATRLELETEPGISINKVRKFFSPSNSFEKEMEVKLEEILEKLEYLVKQKDALCLREGTGGKPSSHRGPTTSRVDESDVYGRENDKEAIMKLLLSNDANGNNLRVISIVGMGWVGKTTIAQLVYNDRRVKEQFDLRLWVCVSEDFDVFKITKDIFKEATSVACDDKTPNQLQVELEKQLVRKNFLLVLDDVWNEKYTEWDILRMPLKSGAPGSRILVTTRHEIVASMMSTILIHHLNALTEDDCWPLLQKHAFGGRNFNGYLHLEIWERKS
uniref:NB-ARC domain-containing protein n=1 Tax=Rhizophora mucronata TaxID=61149 RepID=A0A2P2QLX0_RHIMU